MAHGDLVAPNHFFYSLYKINRIMNEQYNAKDLSVLEGLDPVRHRPGMYTETERPNHLAQEVIDNSVDEALAGHAKKIRVILHEDQSLEVVDDGRGMPVDIHPEKGISGVELIMTKLHAGGKFSNDNYKFSGGLHGVGISVVNALSRRVEVTVKRDGQVHEIAFEGGDAVTELSVTGTCGMRNTGTSVHFGLMLNTSIAQNSPACVWLITYVPKPYSAPGLKLSSVIRSITKSTSGFMKMA